MKAEGSAAMQAVLRISRTGQGTAGQVPFHALPPSHRPQSLCWRKQWWRRWGGQCPQLTHLFTLQRLPPRSQLNLVEVDFFCGHLCIRNYPENYTQAKKSPAPGNAFPLLLHQAASDPATQELFIQTHPKRQPTALELACLNEEWPVLVHKSFEVPESPHPLSERVADATGSYRVMVQAALVFILLCCSLYPPTLLMTGRGQGEPA